MNWSPFTANPFQSLYDELFPYVPPCERNPWYDDPRDVKLNDNKKAEDINDAFKYATESYFGRKIYDQYDSRPDIDNPQQMQQCPKCGTFFIPEPPKTMIFGVPQVEVLCHECREKESISG